jgi:hypothetical protein
MTPGSSGRIALTTETLGEGQPISGDAASNRRVEVCLPISTDVERDVEDILQYIRRQARAAAARPRGINPRSRFARVVASRYLRRYLATPTSATASAAIAAIGRQNTSGRVTPVCGEPDFWEASTPAFNGGPIPPVLRRVPGFTWLPPTFGAATDILTVANRRSLAFIDVPWLLGRRTLDLLDCRTRPVRGRDPDLQANNSINESQLMHWATGVRYAGLGQDRLRDLFLAYELWHLELWDVFGGDPINDLIAEDAGRHMAGEITGLRMNRSNYLPTLDEGFRQARAWVGALLRLRQSALDRQIKAEIPPSAFIHWTQEVPPTDPQHPFKVPSIRQMLASGMSTEAVKASNLVRRYIEVYTLLFEADLWEATRGRVPTTLLQRRMAEGSMNPLFRAAAAAERLAPSFIGRHLTRA